MNQPDTLPTPAAISATRGPSPAGRLRILNAFAKASMAVGVDPPLKAADGAQHGGSIEALSTLARGGGFAGARILSGPHGPYLAVATEGQHGVHFLDPEAFAYLAGLSLFGGGPITTDSPEGSLEAPKLAVLAEMLTDAAEEAPRDTAVPFANLIAEATVSTTVRTISSLVDLRAANLLAVPEAIGEGAQQAAERAALRRHSEHGDGAAIIGAAQYGRLLAELAAAMNAGCGMRVHRRFRPIAVA